VARNKINTDIKIHRTPHTEKKTMCGKPGWETLKEVGHEPQTIRENHKKFTTTLPEQYFEDGFLRKAKWAERPPRLRPDTEKQRMNDYGVSSL